MFQLLTNAQVFAPRSLGRKAVLVCAGKIVYMGDDEPSLDASLPVERTDLEGAVLHKMVVYLILCWGETQNTQELLLMARCLVSTHF